MYISSSPQPRWRKLRNHKFLRPGLQNPLFGVFGIALHFPRCKTLKNGWHKAASSRVELCWASCGSQSNFCSQVPELHFPFKMRSNTKFWNKKIFPNGDVIITHPALTTCTAQRIPWRKGDDNIWGRKEASEQAKPSKLTWFSPVWTVFY